MSLFSVAREKTRNFEFELAATIGKLDVNESKIRNLISHRRDWLSSGTNLEELESTLLKKRIELIRDKLELLRVDSQLEQVRTEAVYENEVLKVLAAATKPLEKGEKKHERDKMIATISHNSTKVVFEAVQKALNHQSLIADSADEMNRNVDIFFIDQEQRRHGRIELLNAKFEKYISALKTIVGSSEDKLKQVTSQYLVLRHNARIAREVLMTNQSKIGREKQILINKITGMRTEVEEQLSSAEIKFESEMNTVVGQRRSEVLRREEELEHDWAELEEARNFYNNDSKTLTKTEKSLKLKLKKLTKQRLRDLQRIEGDLGGLRQATHAAEMEQLHARVVRDDSTEPSTLNAASASRRVNSLSAHDISILNDRLMGLKIALDVNQF
jgi:hypothetical protein